MEAHRPGPLKQQNKRHNSGRHKTKGQIKRSQKGKAGHVQSSRHNKQVLSKQDRKRQAIQLRKMKKEKLQLKVRGIDESNVNDDEAEPMPPLPPHYIAVIPLSDNCNSSDVLTLLTSCEEQTIANTSSQGITHVSYPKLKRRVAYIKPDPTNLAAVLEAVRVCNTVLFVWSLIDAIDEHGESLYTSIFAQGLPATAHVVMGIKGLPLKKQTDVKRLLNKDLEERFTDCKMFPCDSQSDAQTLVRHIVQQKLKMLSSQEIRSQIVAEELAFECDADDKDKGTLKVTGYMRGRRLSVNRLVHIPGYGDFQINRILAPSDPHPLVLRPDKVQKNNENVEMADAESIVLCVADPDSQVDLVSEMAVDPMEGEQTWPTDEELAEATSNAAMVKSKTMVRVPKGTSSYQAAWITDAPIIEESDGSEASEDYADNMDEMEAMSDNSEVSSDEELEAVETGSTAPSVTWGDPVNYDQQMDLDQEKIALNKYKEERENELFPDEVDTPENIPARLRFARYRGLKSFRTSPWNQKENLPLDYSRIFQFENFSRYRQNVLKEKLGLDSIRHGQYITLEIKDVPKEVFDIHSGDKGNLLAVIGLLLSEHKMSVLHFTVRRHSLYTEPVKSKERLIIQCGFRRFICNPIFSDHSNLNKHKYERFLPQSGVCTMSTYAPIMFPPASVMVFKESSNGHDLVASGSLLSVDPDRLIIKRIVLSGHPFKINKKSAVIRYMFYNKEDIEWFKKVELKTKWGRRGHIKEALGTHGHMKCIFDRQLKSQDTPLLLLYKRVFPKWTYTGYVPSSSVNQIEDDQEMREIFR